MKLNVNIKSIILDAICLLYILLFVYAAVSKFRDFENFQTQLGQSPLLSAFASWVAWVVPLVELIIVVFLIFPKLRNIGLFASFSLMVMFTTYIYIILNYSSFVPCSCGGILEKLGWKEHLIFNLIFIVLAILGLFLYYEKEKVNETSFRRIRSKKMNIAFLLLFLLLISGGMVVFLFNKSENIIQYHNTFIRRFPQHPNIETAPIDLKFNSYYFAGAGNGKIYLGNYTAALHVLEYDTILKTRTVHQIKVDKKDLPFQSLQLRVAPPYFFMTDGTVPCIFRGIIQDWSAKLLKFKKPTFTQAEPIDSITIALRAEVPRTGENILAVVNLKDSSEVKYGIGFLKKQIDGIFDTDGSLHVDPVTLELSYLYRYRNQYMTMDNRLEKVHYGQTIDTVSKANIIVDTIQSRNERKFAAPPLIVNRLSISYNDLLFVNSGLRGQYETEKMWKDASIIDIYKLSDRRYLLSLYIYNVGNHKLKQILVYRDNIYVLIDNQLIRYVITPVITDYYKIKIK
ncbi:MauE/DoxX family redox-associated membrane protein [Flavobacterium sp. PL02]|uniref:MauE/DoxX family redox-associated membrane protein n=1 Tax=Flavobacterium sp. PL02 TaxID=3088354 RepID=UPI002B23B7DC|nr:MauE/DoxX family redox-associated membrane protein [Flavobacterium sp. PL02]MEA9414308.1 MauE/DoxX family redox-associated membrane protein [Flavobacterium sp. PL02]